MGPTPALILRDRVAVYGNEFGTKLRGLGVEQRLTQVRALRADAVAERLIGTLRRECLDYTRERPPRTLRLETPLPASRRRWADLRPPRAGWLSS